MNEATPYRNSFNKLARVLYALGKLEKDSPADSNLDQAHRDGRYFGFSRSSEIIDSVLLDIENGMPSATLDRLEHNLLNKEIG